MVRLFLLRLLESFFRRWYLYLLPILLLLVAAVLYPLYSRSTHTARSALYVQKESLLTSLTAIQNSGFAYVTPAKATMDELWALFQTDSFVRAILSQTDLEPDLALGREEVGRLIKNTRDSISVQPLGNNLIQIEVEHEDPVIAEQVAAALVESYIQWKINANREESISAQGFFENLVQVYRTDLENARQDQTLYLMEHPDPVRGDRPMLEVVQLNQLQGAVNEANTRLTNAIDKLDSAKLALAQSESTARQTYLVVDAPYVPPQPATLLEAWDKDTRKMATNAALIVLVGFILSVAGVIGAAVLDSSYRFPVDAQYGLGLPVLAVVPQAPQARRGRKARVGARAAQQRPTPRTVAAQVGGAVRAWTRGTTVLPDDHDAAPETTRSLPDQPEAPLESAPSRPVPARRRQSLHRGAEGQEAAK